MPQPFLGNGKHADADGNENQELPDPATFHYQTLNIGNESNSSRYARSF